jgi:hypothetical protein
MVMRVMETHHAGDDRSARRGRSMVMRVMATRTRGPHIGVAFSMQATASELPRQCPHASVYLGPQAF